MEGTDIHSKTAIVTGASFGIGSGIAYKLAGKGYNLFITHLDEEKQANQVAETIRSEFNQQCRNPHL